MKTLKEVNGGGGFGEGKRVAAREASVAVHWRARRSKVASWWMSLWMWGTSKMVAKRMRAYNGCRIGAVSGIVFSGVVVGSGGGGGGAAASIAFFERGFGSKEVFAREVTTTTLLLH